MLIAGIGLGNGARAPDPVPGVIIILGRTATLEGARTAGDDDLWFILVLTTAVFLTAWPLVFELPLGERWSRCTTFGVAERMRAAAVSSMEDDSVNERSVS